MGNQYEMIGGVWRRRRRLGLGGARLLVLAGVSAFAGWSFMQRATVSQPVELVAVQQRDVPIWGYSIGQVQPSHAVLVRAAVQGQLKQIAVQEGQQVKQGDVLAQIDDASYLAQLEKAKANKAQDEAQLAAAQQELKALTKLGKNANSSRQAALKLAIRQFEAAIKSDVAAITQASAQLAATRITAPISGRVGLRRTDVGNLISPSDPEGLMEITQMQPVDVLFTLGDQMFHRLQSKSDVSVQILDSGKSSILASGALRLADNHVDESSGGMRMKARFENQNGALWPGATVNVRVQLQAMPSALVVPASALLRNGPRSYVYVADKEGKKVSLREIQLALVNDDEAVIQSGVAAGEQVVIQQAGQQASAAQAASGLQPAR